MKRECLEAAHEETVDLARKENLEKKQRGKLIVRKIQMRRKFELEPGYLHIFPNNKHGERTDGLGLPALSPMRLGPVEHGQKHMPPALLLENFWQGSKCFKSEADEKGDPLPEFWETQKKWFNDKVPHRHKYKRGMKPLCWVWVSKTNEMHKLNWVQSRQFYCEFYARLASKQPDLELIKTKLDEGYNVALCGYDGRAIKASEVEKEYLSDKAPFGHELVLFTMVAVPEAQWPWKKYKTFEF